MTSRTILNLLACLTPRRAWNLLRLGLSYALSVSLRRPVFFGMPFALTVEPTNLCNLRCPECPSGAGTLNRPLGSMSLDRFRGIIDSVHRDTWYLQLFFQGEPFLNRDLLAMIRLARARRMYVSLSTNAHFITRDNAAGLLATGVDRLIVSLDGVTEESYRTYRVGGSFAKVRDALDTLRDARGTPGRDRTDLVLQFLVTRANEAEIPALRTLARECGARPVLKTMQVYSMEGAERFLPTERRYRRYDIEDGALLLRGALRNRCSQLWKRAVITWDGDVLPCCFDKSAEHPFGSVLASDLRAVLRSAAALSFRHRVFTRRADTPICTNCTEGVRIYRR
jgi:MoaA/NifB/PqqE/SkfB family radical SAM enzyme